MTRSGVMGICALMLVCPAIMAAEVTTNFVQDAAAPQKSHPLLVTVESVRISDADIAELGFDWLLPKRASGKNDAELCGIFLKPQYAVVKRALNLSKTPVVWSRETTRVQSGEIAVESRWAKKQPAFTLKLNEQAGQVEVVLAGVEKRTTLFVDPATGNVLLYELPSTEKGMHELYFVMVESAVAPKVNPNRKPQIEIAVRVAQVPESVFLEHEAGFQDAVRAGDLTRLDSQKGVDLMILPRVTTVEGQAATINVIREYRYPVEFEAGPTDVLTPTSFDTANLGVTFEINTSLTDEKIQLRGKLIVREFEGMTRGDLGTFAPAFQSTEANVFRVLNDGQTLGFWLPGVRTVRKSGDLAGDVTSGAPDFQSPPNPAEAARYKMAVVVTTSVFKPNLRSSVAPPSMDVVVYDVTRTKLGQEFLESNKVDGPAYALAKILGKKDEVPADAVKLKIEKNYSTSWFESPAGTDCSIELSTLPLQAVVSMTPPSMNPPRRPPSYVTVLRYEDGDKAVMVLGNSKSKKSEVLLIAFRALSGMKPSSDGKIPAGSPITGMSGFITSPYAPNEGYIDVRGYKSGAEVKDPYTGNMITVP